MMNCRGNMTANKDIYTINYFEVLTTPNEKGMYKVVPSI